jgi:hypothetical protein
MPRLFAVIRSLHRMLGTLGKEDQTRSEIKKRYSGSVEFANDLDCLPVG